MSYRQTLIGVLNGALVGLGIALECVYCGQSIIGYLFIALGVLSMVLADRISK